MSKTRIKYICSNCGYESLRWLGKCPECDSWNTFTEEIVETNKRKPAAYKGNLNIKKINEIEGVEENRIATGIGELDRVLGGGFIPGSVILLGGDPGIGKSTLAMQAASKVNHNILYVTGEESTAQIKSRAARLKIKSDNFFVLAETDINIIIASINSLAPSLVIIDSIQTMYRSELDNSPGTITQIRECTSQVMAVAKKNQISILIVGHVTKEGFHCRTKSSRAHGRYCNPV